jgi:leucyl-tRNA synthetase
MEKSYQPQSIEKAVQHYWAEKDAFAVKEDSTLEKFYCLSMLPYPSGELHMGHVRNYTIGDVISRYQRMCGKNVLQPMSWDAFGLPAENAALKNKTAPAVWTYQNIDEMRTQLQRLGYAIDWRREVTTCQPTYYRWEQWLFTKLFKKGLVYRKNSIVNWDPVDNTVLANEQVIDGRGWRSGALVERREIPQWFFKITAFADELVDELDTLTGWPEEVKSMQRNWIGRSEGTEVDFNVTLSPTQDLSAATLTSKDPALDAAPPTVLRVYTTRVDTLLGVTYLAIAPEHPLAKHAAQHQPALAAFLTECQHRKTAEAALATLDKKGMDTGLTAIHPITQKIIPIWVANYVLMEYGSGAVMAVPAHDQRDFEFRQQYNLPLLQVIQPVGTSWDIDEKPFLTEGVLINSDLFDGLSSQQAKHAITNHLVDKKQGKHCINYRLRDWGISRQRYWGAPIPIIYCADCGEVAVPEQDLPVLLPENVVLDSSQAALKNLAEFHQTLCPNCGKPAKRDTDTFDTFVESSWYFARSTCPDQTQTMLDARAHYWLPVDHYVGGIEHAVLHLLYARFFYKVLRNEGLVPGDEPFTRLLTQGMVLKDGAKMSKSKGNTVSPKDLIAQYGADTVRLFAIFAAPPEQSLEWSDNGVEGAYRFLKRLWSAACQATALISEAPQSSTVADSTPPLLRAATASIKTTRREIHEILQQATQDIQQQQFNTIVSAAMKLLNLLTKITLAAENSLLIQEGYSILLRILAPITPHITHHLWKQLGFGEDILVTNWPAVDVSALQTDTVKLVVQINGKLRGEIIVANDADEEMIKQTALNEPNVSRHLNGQSPKKVIVVPKKLVSVVV